MESYMGSNSVSVKEGRSIRQAVAWKKLVQSVTSRFHKSENSFALESMNPMWGMSTHEAQMIFDLARSGNYARLQLIYDEIEKCDPTLLVCVTRRCAALSELDWKVVRSDQKRMEEPADIEEERKIKELDALAQDQIECLETEFAKVENLPDAVEHLALGAFRGYSHISPIHGTDGCLKRFDLLDSWNFCWDRHQQAWLWNPTASSFMNPRAGQNGLQIIPKEELVSVREPRPIDWPGLKIYLRTAVAERDWGRFLETYGLPPVIITMPDFTSDDDAEKFEKAAESVFEGRSGVVPYGSEVNYASESRGTDPFSAFIEHQQKQIVLMATGGILTSLAESGSGTLGGNAHEDTWLQIVRRDVRKISNVLNKQCGEEILARKFPGKPVLAEFKLETERDPSPKEVFEMASTASQAGYQIDPKEIEEQSGYTVTLKDNGGGMPGMGAGDQGVGSVEGDDGESTNAEEGGAEAPGERGETTPEGGTDSGKEATGGVFALMGEGGAEQKPVTNAQQNQPTTPAQRLAWSLQLDFKPVADRINEIIQMPEDKQPAAAEKLIGELDGLVSEDPAMASVIAEEMAKVFDKVPGATKVTVEPVNEEVR